MKLSPNVAAIEPFARICEQSGADAISLINTFISLAIDAKTRQPRIGAGYGGLSGPGDQADRPADGASGGERREDPGNRPRRNRQR